MTRYCKQSSIKSTFTPEEIAAWRPKRGERNTYHYTTPEGDTVTRLHKTDIVRVSKRGTITLDSGGWRTMTTSDRMNAALRPHGYCIVKNRAGWQVARLRDPDAGLWCESNAGASRVYYTDGMKLPQAFSARNLAKAEKQAARDAKLKAAIKRFADKLTRDNWPMPSGGDCWVCQGMSPGDGHLREHIKQGYLHGTLLENAIAWAGYNPAAYFQMRLVAQARKCLRSYLQAQLGLTHR